MNPFRLIICFIKVSFQEETAYRSNFLINFLYSILNLATGILGIVILFGQIQNIQGWTLPDTLALLGVYLTISAMRALFIVPVWNRWQVWMGKSGAVHLISHS